MDGGKGWLTAGVLAVLRKDITRDDLAYADPYWPSVYFGRRCRRILAAKVVHIEQVHEGVLSARSLAFKAFAVR